MGAATGVFAFCPAGRRCYVFRLLRAFAAIDILLVSLAIYVIATAFRAFDVGVGSCVG